ncbi:MAG TPA: hypothetical protein VIT23_03955, partial [Terrimicrobiaceae bacterium]
MENNKIHTYTLSRTAEPVEIEKLAGWRPHRRPSSPNPPRFYSAIAFLVGFCQPVTIGFVGKIPLSELLLLVVLLHCAIALAIGRTLPAPLPSPRILALVVVAQLLAFGSYVVSDLWWQSLPYDLMRGWVRMLFLLLDTVALALLFGAGSQTFVLLQVGVIFSSFLIFMEGPLFGDFWKFCFAYPVTLLVLLATPPLLGLWASIATTLGLGMLHLFMGYRSLGIGCLLLASLLVGSNTLSRLWRKYLFLICAPLCLATLPWAVESVFSDTQERAGRSNVERSAMIQAAWEGFLTSPLIGNGSWFSKSDVWDNFLMIRSEKEAAAGRG